MRMAQHVLMNVNVAGETQACMLTKSQPFYELPPAVANLENVLEIPDQVPMT